MRLTGAFVFIVWPLHYNKNLSTKMYRKALFTLLEKIIFMDVVRVLKNIYGVHAYF